MTDAVSLLSAAKRIVVKVGSSLLVKDDLQLDTAWMALLAQDMMALQQKGVEIILVSSGAVAAGRERLGLTPPLKLEEKQAAAAAGQAHLIQAYEKAFNDPAMRVAQLLVTADMADNRRSYLNARSTLQTLLELGALPIVNENDTVATQELRYGDNDRLAAHVAQMACAEALVLLSDVDGLYSADPARDPAAVFHAQIDHITPEIIAMAGGSSGSGMGSGGMATKVQAAQIATTAGCATIIARGKENDRKPLLSLLEGAQCSVFTAHGTPGSARSQWIGSRLSVAGTITVDDGAAKALQEGASLLPVGMTGVTGSFGKGDAVEIVSQTGTPLAKGLAGYHAEDAIKMIGLKSEDVAKTLGYETRGIMVHRDDMVLLN
jgi:glutamate 5-kinase